MVLLRISRNISVADISQASTGQFQCYWFVAFLFSLQRTFGRKRNQNQRGSFKDGVFANQIAHGCGKKTTGMFPVHVAVHVPAAGKDQKGNLASPAAEYEIIQFRSLDSYMSMFLQPETSTCTTDFSSPPSLRYFKHRHVLLLECVPLWHAKK